MRAVFRILALVAPTAFASAQGPPYYGLTPLEPYGMYTDRPSYEPGETIEVYADWEIVAPATEVHVRYDLVQVGSGAVLASTTQDFDTPQSTDLPYGSFVDFPPAMTVGGRPKWTIEGWFRPTSVFDGSGDATEGDWIAIAGEMDLGGTEGIDGVAGIGIDPDGVLFAMVKTDDGTVHVVRDDVDTLHPDDAWYYVAAVFTGKKLRLWFEPEGTALDTAFVGDLGGTFTTFVDPDPELTFRLGARKEAPGDETGCFDGRLDRWTVWDGVLTRSQLQARKSGGEPGGSYLLAEPGDPAFPPRRLAVGFEDAYECTWDPIGSYRCTVHDASPNGYDGVLVNHGTPGMAGRPENGRGLRLNHDQLVDAQWAVHATLTAPATSGMYYVQATDTDTAGLLGRCALVVRPAAPTPGAELALIVPVNTWVAYNTWPGSSFGGGTTAPGLTVRFEGGQALPQGNNSTYARMGDGRSFAHYLGWRRPSAPADPGASSVHAAMARKVFLWLHGLNARPAGTGICVDVDDPIVWDAYTDWDLHSGHLDLSDYPVVMTMAHHEYWSETMLDALVDYVRAGGNVINVGGNLFAYRSELSTDGSGDVTGIVEVKKWPTHTKSLGKYDGYSAIGGGRTGVWRYIEQCRTADAEPPPPFPYTRDYVLGTLNHMVVPCGPVPACWGDWKVRANAHPMWGGEVAFGEELGLDTVGHETDMFLESPPVCTGTQYITFAEWGTQVWILAEGTNFTAGALPGAIDYQHPSYCLDCDGLDAASELGFTSEYWASRTPGLSGPSPESGHIVYYEGNFGQKVLSIASTAAPSALLGAANVKISHLVERAFCCMARGECP